MVTFVIVDGNPNSDFLKKLLEEHHPDITLAGIAANAAAAMKLIYETSPDLVFMDIEIGMTYFQKVSKYHFSVVFTTPHPLLAINAFEYKALHCLLYPVNEKSLAEAICRFRQKKESDFLKEFFSQADTTSLLHHAPPRIVVPFENSYRVFDTSSLMYALGDGSYTTLYFQDSKDPVLISQRLGIIEGKLKEDKFLRIHKSNLINTDFIHSYSPGAMTVTMINYKELDISESHRTDFLNKVNQI